MGFKTFGFGGFVKISGKRKMIFTGERKVLGLTIALHCERELENPRSGSNGSYLC